MSRHRTMKYEVVRCGTVPSDMHKMLYRSIKEALTVIAAAIVDGEEWCVVEIPPGEDIGYDGMPVARVTWERGC